MPRLLLIPVFAILLGCTAFPELDDAISDQARLSGYPTLAPFDDLMARAGDPAANTSTEEIEALRSRARLLNARARILRRTEVVDSDAQLRMKAAFDRLTNR